MPEEKPHHTSHGVLPPEAAAAAAPPAPVYLTPIETSAQNDSKVPEKGLPPLSPFQSFYHSGWQPKRSRIFDALERTGQPEHRCRAFADCCRHGRPEWKGQVESEATEWRIVTDRCHDRLCEICAASKAFDIRLALYDQLGQASHKFITLTLKARPQEPLTKTIDRLFDSFKQLRRLKLWDDAVRGGCAFLEVTRGQQNKHWHAHLHVIADATFISKAELSNAWRAVTQDSYIVDIQVAGGKTSAGYVTKYVTKAMPASLLTEATALDEFIMAIKGRRLCTTFGDWYGKATLAALDDDTLNLGQGDGWHGTTVYTIDALLRFLPPTPAAAALVKLPVLRWLRTAARGGAPPPPNTP